MYGLNSTGYAPSDISIEKVKAQVTDGKMPVFGWTHCDSTWCAQGLGGSERALWQSEPGREIWLRLSAMLRRATLFSPMLAHSFERATKKFHGLFDGKHEYDEWFRVFTQNGESYHFGDIIKLPDHAKTLRLIAQTNAKAFYEAKSPRPLWLRVSGMAASSLRKT